MHLADRADGARLDEFDRPPVVAALVYLRAQLGDEFLSRATLSHQAGFVDIVRQRLFA